MCAVVSIAKADDKPGEQCVGAIFACAFVEECGKAMTAANAACDKSAFANLPSSLPDTCRNALRELRKIPTGADFFKCFPKEVDQHLQK